MKWLSLILFFASVLRSETPTKLVGKRLEEFQEELNRLGRIKYEGNALALAGQLAEKFRNSCYESKDPFDLVALRPQGPLDEKVSLVLQKLTATWKPCPEAPAPLVLHGIGPPRSTKTALPTKGQWRPLGLASDRFVAVAAEDNQVIAASEKEVYVSTKAGEDLSWEPQLRNFRVGRIEAATLAGGAAFVGAKSMGLPATIYALSNRGTNEWDSKNISNVSEVKALATSPSGH